MIQKNRDNLFAGKLVSYFTSLMALIYLFAGVYLLTNNSIKEQFGATFCLTIGLGLVAYGIFRLYRSYIFWKFNE